jgi:hypothetical protein
VKIKHITKRGAFFKRRSPVPGSAIVGRRSRTFLEKVLLAVPFGAASLLATAGYAMAQATSPAGGLGAQLNTMSSEGLNAGSLLFEAACYLAATICFGFGVWALWQSRQPQNRETGYVGRGVAGLILCGLFATAGVWINKASISASGGAASINNTPQMVTFGAGG